MKRSFVYLILALALSVLLCGCGSMTDDGNVAASPWPDVTTPILPTQSPAPSATPVPGTNGNSTPEIGNGTPMPDMNSAAPRPTAN